MYRKSHLLFFGFLSLPTALQATQLQESGSKPTYNMQQNVSLQDFQSDSQKQAMDYVTRIGLGIEETNYGSILSGLHGLWKIKVTDLHKMPQPNVILRELSAQFSHDNSTTLNVGFKYHIARQAKRFSQALFLANYGANTNKELQKVKTSTLENLLQDVLSPVYESSQPAAGLRFELECIRAMIGWLEDGKSTKDKIQEEDMSMLLELFKSTADTSLAIAMQNYGDISDELKTIVLDLPLNKCKQAYDYAVRKFCAKWYGEVLYIDYLSRRAAGSEPHRKALLEKLDKLEEKLKTINTPKWQIVYVMLEAITNTIRKHNSEQCTRFIARALFKKLRPYTAFKKYKIHNNWRIRERVARSVIALSIFKDTSVEIKAQAVVAEQLLKEKDPHVRLLLSQPQYVTVLEKPILQAPSDPKSELEETEENLTQKFKVALETQKNV